MAIGGLSLDLGGGATSGTAYAQSATGYTTSLGTKNFIFLLPRLQDYSTAGNNTRAFSAYFDSNDYFALYSNNTTAGSALQLRVEWNANGTKALIDFKTVTPNETYEYGVRHKSIAVWRDGTAFKGGMLDFGGASDTKDPAFVVKTSATALVAGHDWGVLDAGFIQLCRFNATQQGTMAYGPIIIVEFSGSFTWTNADVERALMDPSSIPDIITLRGGCSIVHQWDAVSRSSVVQSPEWRMDIQTGDVIEDTVGGVDMTITLGTGTPKLYRPFTAPGRWDSTNGKWQNVLENFYPIGAEDPDGGYWYTRQAGNPTSYQHSYLCHCDASGVDDRHPIPLPGKMAYFAEGDGPWADRTEITGDMTPGMASILNEYHHGTAIDVAGGQIRLLHRRHSVTAVSGGSPTTPVVASSRYIHGAEYAQFAQTARGDVDAVVPSLSEMGFTLPASGNTSLEYESVSGSYAAIYNDGTYFYEIGRAGGGTNGYLVATRTNISTGSSDAVIKLTTSDLSGTGTPPLAIVPIDADHIGLVFSVRDPTSSFMTGARMIVLDVSGTWSEGDDFYDLSGVPLTLPLSQDEMRDGPDNTNTDITGFGATAADVGYGRVVGNGAGTVIAAVFHQVANAGVYDGTKMAFKVVVKSGWAAGTGFASSTTLDITALVEAEVPGWREASGKNQWSAPQVVWLNSARTIALVCFTDPDGSTMVANGTSLGGCADTPRFGTRVLGVIIANLDGTPTATWYGEVYVCAGDILSVDIPSFAGSAYVPFLMLQGYVGATSLSNDLLGQIIYEPVDLPGIVTLTAPADNATDQSTTLTFSWTAFSGADHYHLFYTPDGGSEVEVADIAGTSHQVSGLDPNTLYTWYVTAHESVDGPVPLAESETREFTTAAASDSASSTAISIGLGIGI